MMALTIDLGNSVKQLEQLAEAADKANGYSAAVVNSKAYAAAVEKGFTKKAVYWKDMSKAQRWAILKSMEAKGKSYKYKREGTKVTRSEDPKGFSIHVPGAGMVEKSIPDITQFMHQFAGQPLVIGTANPFERIVDETALYSLIPITEKTPIQNGGSGLAGAWSVKTGYNP